MKKITFFCMFFIIFSASCFAKTDLDKSIEQSSISIIETVKKDTVVAVLGFTAETKQLGEYIRDQITYQLTNEKKITVVTRNHMDLVEKELNYQMSGFVSDNTALSICERTGAQAIIFGQIEELDNNFLLQVKMLDVEKGTYIFYKTYTISRSKKMEQLLGRAAFYYKSNIGLQVEGNMNSLAGITPAAGISFDYNITRKIGMGLRTILSYDINTKDFNIFCFEPLFIFRYYTVSPSGEPGTGLFVETSAGGEFVVVDQYLNISGDAGIGVGYRFGLNQFYIDTSIRGGYPFITGANISLGMRF